MGHIVSMLLVRRESLSILCAAYSFVKECKGKRTWLWESVTKELWCVRALMPLLYTNMRRPWATRVGAFDASPWGHGVCEAAVDQHAVQRTGQVSERCRFRGPLAATVAPREAAEEWEANAEGRHNDNLTKAIALDRDRPWRF